MSSAEFAFEFRDYCWILLLQALRENPSMGRNELLHHMLVRYRWRHGITKKYLAEGKRRGYITSEAAGPRGKQTYAVQPA